MTQYSTDRGLWYGGSSSGSPDPLAPNPEPDRSVRGLHGSAGMGPPASHLWEFWVGELKAMGVRYYKQLDNGDPNDVGGSSTFAWLRLLKANGIEPIVRFYRHRQFPDGLPGHVFEKMKRYAEIGVTYAEIGNEPNLPIEWQEEPAKALSWNDPYFPNLLARRWALDAIATLNAGMRPGFYALAPTDWGDGRPHPTLSSVQFYNRIFRIVRSIPDVKAAYEEAFGRGAWLSVHVSPYEFPFDFDPSPPGGLYWDMCLRGYEIPVMELDFSGFSGYEIISTEGGVFCVNSLSMTGHKRLSTHEQHAERTIAMFEWLAKKAPKNFVGMCPWLICNDDRIGHHDSLWENDAWYRPDRTLPVVQYMKNSNEE